MKKEYKKVDFTKAMSDVKNLLNELYDIKPKKSWANYKGEDITHYSITATSLTLKDAISKGNVEYQKGQGRTPIDIVLEKVFQLGYSQAKIIEENDPINKFYRELAQSKIKDLELKQQSMK